MVRLTARRYRRLLIAAVITLLISAALLGLVGAIRWRGRQALRSDTDAVISQVRAQLIRSLQSRRGTLTLLRDTLKRRSDLSLPQLGALGDSAVEHTRHLLGTGFLRPALPPTWWSKPAGLSAAELSHVNQAIAKRTRLRGVWRVPSTFVVPAAPRRPLLIMLEPLRASAGRQGAVIGVFDLRPLLEDFFTSGTVQPYPATLLDGATLLYRSPDWRAATLEHAPVTVEDPVKLDAERWTLQMQPGKSGVVQALSWFNVLLISLSAIAGLGIITIVWLLAARTWLLQRAVVRRTAALRRSRERLRQLATTDELTGLYNRRFFLSRWEWECERAKRYRRPLACLMIDVNGFKQVNDRLGHPAGDLVLKQVAQELKTLLRQSDILARFGGDEFIAALPETSLAQATSVAEKLRQVTIPVAAGAAKGVGAVTLSVGLSRVVEADKSPQEILEAADQSLYASKASKHSP